LKIGVRRSPLQISEATFAARGKLLHELEHPKPPAGHD
jgi:hypothetical protein